MQVAIVGGGVSGSYCAYRLARAHPDWDMHLFEASDRFGGRLWSVPLDGIATTPAEMGAMFISNRHFNLFALLQHLGLEPRPLNWSSKHQFIRGCYLHNTSYTTDPDGVPFKLGDAERGKNPGALLRYALGQIVPTLDELWPFNTTAKPRATYAFLRRVHHDGRALADWGFWNLLSDVVSNEAYDLLLATIGVGSILRNANAFESIWTLLRDMDRAQIYHRLEGGYQQLPLTLLEQAKHAVKMHAGKRLVHLGRDRDGFAMRFATARGEKTKRADKVILALPRRALGLVAFDADLFDDAGAFHNNLDAVSSAPACKVFMTFDQPWWDHSVFGPSAVGPAEIAASYTDMPMRQCFYYGQPGATGPAMLMAAYADDAADSFWTGLVYKGDDYPCPAANAVDRKRLTCSKSMVNAALRQLRAMHHDQAVPAPTGALFVDWHGDPFAGGWHDWAPGRRSWDIGPKLRQPNPRLDWFICGEAYSQRQGWVEGAINSAEMVLRRLGVDPPEWLDEPGFEFEVEGEFEMKSKLMELLIALSESLPLQRAYARDKDAIMKAFGLSDVEMAALRAGDINAIKSLTSDVVIYNNIIWASPPCE